MEYDLRLSKEELDFIVNALQYLENENLKKSLIAVKSMKYEDVKELYADEQSFISDMKYKKQIINEQIEAIENTVDKLEDIMYGKNEKNE